MKKIIAVYSAILSFGIFKLEARNYYVVESELEKYSNFVNQLKSEITKEESKFQSSYIKAQQEIAEGQQKIAPDDKTAQLSMEEIKHKAEGNVLHERVKLQKFEIKKKDEFDSIKEAAAEEFLSKTSDAESVQFIISEKANNLKVAKSSKVTQKFAELMDKVAETKDEEKALMAAIKPIDEKKSSKNLLVASSDLSEKKENKKA